MNRKVTSVWIVVSILIATFLGLSFLENGKVTSETYVSGVQYDTNGGPWTKAASPYIITGNVVVPAGETLTIEPGAVVKFDGYYYLSIDGTLVAKGNETDRIIITSNSTSPSIGDWNQIDINSTGRVEIQYCNISYAFVGIGFVFSSSPNSIVTNNNIWNNTRGIELWGSSNITITYNNVHSNSNYGFRITASSNNNIANNNVHSNTDDGIYLWLSSSNNTMANNSVYSNNDDGIFIEPASDHNIIVNNTVYSNYNYGINIESSYNNITNNNIFSNLQRGIRAYQSSNNSITHNNVSNNWYGISLSDSKNSTISNNNVSSNGWYGISLSWSSNSNITDNTFIDDGLFIDGYILSHFNTQTIPTSNLVNGRPLRYYKDSSGLDIDGIEVGQLILANCTYINMSNLQINDTDCGIEVALSTNINITTNKILSNNNDGIYLLYSSNNNIINNNISNNTYNGIYLKESSNNSITANNNSGNSIGIDLWDNSSNNTITCNNLRNNGRGVWIIDSSNNTITNNIVYSNGAEGISFGNSANDNIVTNNNVSGSVYGIKLSSSSNKNRITDNNIFSNSQLGIIMMYSSSDNQVTNNNLSNNGIGIQLSASSNNSVSNNRLSNNWRGIHLDSSSNISITGNKVYSSSGYGICLWSFSNNTIITNNTVFSSDGYGIYLNLSSNNRIYGNNLIENKNQAYDDMNDNLWNESYPAGGNYWSDFDDPVEGAYDDYQGTDQNGLGSDGIVDLGLPIGGKNPYVIDAGSQDNYPLVHPIGNYTLLFDGWNLISIPFIQSDTNLGAVLSFIAGSYDAVQWYNSKYVSDPWKHNHTGKPQNLNDLDALDHTMGFWVRIIKPGGTLFEYHGIEPAINQTITLHPGWNLVGYPSLSNHNRTVGLNNLTFGPDVDSIQWYDAATKTWHFMGPDDHFVPGRGYWMHSNIEAVWEVPL